MNEKEIRDRIERFLKKTARTVVVPASMGLSLSACDHNALASKRADAGQDGGATAPAPDLGPDFANIAPPYLAPIDPPDAAADVPTLVLPYVVVMERDAADSQKVDADLTDASADVGPDIATPPPPYLLYHVPSSVEDHGAESKGATAPMPASANKKKE